MGAVEEVNGGDNLRLLLLAVVLVSWACAEGVAPTRQFDNAADANLARPDAQTDGSLDTPPRYATVRQRPKRLVAEQLFQQRFSGSIIDPHLGVEI